MRILAGRQAGKPFPHCKDTTENSKHIFPEKELHGRSPNLYIHVSVSSLYVHSHNWSAYTAGGKYV
jgi:hypothetical protein